MVLFRIAIGPESNCGAEVPAVSRVACLGGGHHQPEARRSKAPRVRSCRFGLLSPELAAGIRRVKGVKQLGFRAGNWLNHDQARLLLEKSDGESLRSSRDVAMISVLLGCGLRRAELASLRKEDVQLWQGHWAMVDLVGKGATSAPFRCHSG
jgi:integrase